MPITNEIVFVKGVQKWTMTYININNKKDTLVTQNDFTGHLNGKRRDE